MRYNRRDFIKGAATCSRPARQAASSVRQSACTPRAAANLGNSRGLRRSGSCDFASQSSSLRSSANLTPSAQANPATQQKGRVEVGEIVLPKWTIEFAMGNCV